MTKYLLLILCGVLLTATSLNIDVSIAPGISVKNALLYLVFIVIAVETAVARNRDIELVPVLLPFFMLVVYGTFTWVVVLTFFDYSWYRPLPTLISLKGGLIDRFLIFFVFFYGLLNSDDATWLLRKLLWMIVIVNIVTILDVWNVPNLGLVTEEEDGRVAGIFDQPNEYGAFCAVFIPAIAALFWGERGSKRIFAGIGLFVSVLALFMTASRGAIVGLVLGLILGTIYMRKYVPRQLALRAAAVFAVFCLIIVGVLIAVGYGQLLEDRFIAQSSERAIEDLSSGRSYIWGTALMEMLEHPITFVTGFGWSVYEFSGQFRYGTHNNYLNILFNLGFLGLSLFLITALNALATGRHALVSTQGEVFSQLMAFEFGFLTILTAILFSQPATAWIFIWAYVGIMMRLTIEGKSAATSRSPGTQAGTIRRFREIPKPTAPQK